MSAAGQAEVGPADPQPAMVRGRLDQGTQKLAVGGLDGCLRGERGSGLADKVSVRDGATFVRWGVASLVLFGANIAAEVVIDLIGLRRGQPSPAPSNPWTSPSG